jgi:hypothetical protein
MLRAQARLIALGAAAPGSPEQLEHDALRDAIEHYRCITELGSGLRPTQAPRARQPDLARPS